MNLSEWKEHFGKLLEEEIDKSLDEHSDEIFQENPLKSKAVQQRQTKEELMRLFHLDDSMEQIERALSLIRDMLPQRISREDWERCRDEFFACGDSLCEFFEKQASEGDNSEEYVPPHQMLGLSTETLGYCYELGQWYYEEKDFENGRSIIGFLTLIAPYVPEFWISLGMCYNKMENYQKAIDIYKAAQELFQDDPALYIHCANNYLANGDATHAAIELDEIKKIFNEHPEQKANWEKMYDYLRGRLDKLNEQQ